MLLQQTKGDASQGRKVRASVPLMNTALVFSEAHIQLPMKIVLDPPVPTQRLAVFSSPHSSAADEITHLRGRFTSDRDLAVDHADRRQFWPLSPITYSFDIVDHRIGPLFLTPVARFFLGIGINVLGRHLAVQGFSHGCLNIIE